MSLDAPYLAPQFHVASGQHLLLRAAGAPPSNERGSALGMTLTACTCPACQPREGPDDCTCSELEEGQTCEFCVEDEKQGCINPSGEENKPMI